MKWFFQISVLLVIFWQCMCQSDFFKVSDMEIWKDYRIINFNSQKNIIINKMK